MRMAAQAASMVFAAAIWMPLAQAQQVTTADDDLAARSRQQDEILLADRPYAQDEWRAMNLAQSPRQHAMVCLEGGTRQAYVVYPQGSAKAPLVVMMPEDQGINNWSKEMADEIAAMGAIVVVPDWLAGRGPNHGGRASFPDTKSALMANYAITQAMTTEEQNFWADWGEKLPRYNGRLAALGFGWGAGRSFWFATQRKDLRAAFIFYDWAPPEAELARLAAPVYGFYAETDTRVERTIEPTKKIMARLGKQYEVVDYKGADHMFMRLGAMAADTNAANLYARNDAMARLQKLIEALR